MPESPWFVYLLECADNTLYCGITTDTDRRVAEHNAGTGAKYTRARRPVRMIAYRSCPDKSSALRLEIALKKLPRNRKLAALNSAAKEEPPCPS